MLAVTSETVAAELEICIEQKIKNPHGLHPDTPEKATQGSKNQEFIPFQGLMNVYLKNGIT